MRPSPWPPGSALAPPCLLPALLSHTLPHRFLRSTALTSWWLTLERSQHASALRPLPSLFLVPGLLCPSPLCGLTHLLRSLRSVIFLPKACHDDFRFPVLGHGSVLCSACFLLVYYVLCLLSVSFHGCVSLMQAKIGACFVRWCISSSSDVSALPTANN